MRDSSKLGVVFTLKEYRLLSGATLLTQPYEGWVKKAEKRGRGFRMEFTSRQLKRFVRYLDFEKSWFDYGPKRRLLRVIIGRLEEFLRMTTVMKRHTSLTS